QPADQPPSRGRSPVPACCPRKRSPESEAASPPRQRLPLGVKNRGKSSTSPAIEGVLHFCIGSGQKPNARCLSLDSCAPQHKLPIGWFDLSMPFLGVSSLDLTVS